MTISKIREGLKSLPSVILIFLIPLSGIIPIRGEQVWFPQYLAFLFLLGLFAVFKIWGFNKYLALFSLTAVLSAVFITRFEPRAVMCMIGLFGGIFLAKIISGFNEKTKVWLLNSLIVYTVLHSLYLVVQFFNKDPFFKSIYAGRINEMVGLCGSPDIAGTVFSILFIVLLAKMPYLCILPLIGVIASKSSFSYTATIMGSLFYLYFTNKRLFKYGLVVILTGSVLFFLKIDKLQKADFITRGSVYASSLISVVKGQLIIEQSEPMMIVTKPYLGFGLGNFLRLFPYTPGYGKFNYTNEKFTHAHNDLIEMTFELGILGLITFLIFLGNLIYRIVKSDKTKELYLYLACLIAYFINAQGHFVSQVAITASLMILFYGLLEGELRGSTANSS